MNPKAFRLPSPPTTYRMPAEWEPHEATWLGWPHELTDWPGKFAPIPWAFAEIVRRLACVERVFLLVENRAAAARVKTILRKSGVGLDAITFFHVPTDRGWMRDSGPICVVGREADVECGGSPPLLLAVARQSSIVASVGMGREKAGASSRTPHNARASATKQKEILPDTQRRDAKTASGKSLPEDDGGTSTPYTQHPARLSHAGSALLNFAFNGWAKYDDHKKDAKVVARVNAKLKRRVILPEHKSKRVVLEGGAIDVNGCGTLLTTEECLLSRVQERNPGFTRDDYAEIFRRYLGVRNVLWLRNGIAGDDTHGHVDDLARFVDPSTVVTVLENDPAEANYAPLQENLALLREMKDQDGRPLRVETLPMPEPVWFDGQRLPASYANFYIANKIVLVPTFNDPADRVALATLAALFPGREIVPIYCRDLVLGLGTIHCMTQQLGRGPFENNEANPNRLLGDFCATA
jgi:agmatine/peptidylarginine deiminase